MQRRCGEGLFRATRVQLFWHVVLKVLAPYATMIAFTLWQAHCAERSRQMEDQQLLDIKRRMMNSEALAVLNMDVHSHLPLQGENLQEARQRYHDFFAKAEKCGSPYLMGKFSEAFRVVSTPEGPSAS